MQQLFLQFLVLFLLSLTSQSISLNTKWKQGFKSTIQITSFSAALFFTSSVLIPSTTFIQPVHAVSQQQQAYIYKSGKAPYLATGSPSDTKDDKGPGGRKETGFLRAMSNCKTKCQQPGEGLAKNDCIQDCQDQCCNSYEQCSFRIKSTAGNAI